jgi:hypothetical protein
MPKRMLPPEIEKTLDKLGSDGDKVRGTLERDFAAYVNQRQKDRRAVPTVLLLAALRPALSYGARRAMEIITAPPSDEPATRIGQLWSEIGTRAGELRAEAATRTEGARASAEAPPRRPKGSSIGPPMPPRSRWTAFAVTGRRRTSPRPRSRHRMQGTRRPGSDTDRDPSGTLARDATVRVAGSPRQRAADVDRDLGFERLVFFSDAVFAIAITLLIIEVRLPALPDDPTDADIVAALRQTLPSIFAYVLSFATIGLYCCRTGGAGATSRG